MKRVLLIALALMSSICSAQTFKVQNLSVLGTSLLSGAATFTLSPTIPTPAIGDNSTNGVTSAFVARHAPCPSIMDNGGDNTGASDNSTAFATTAALGPIGQACVFFPAGKYKFSAQLVYTAPAAPSSISILGMGGDASILYWPAGGGLKINVSGTNNAAHIRDLSFTTGSINTGSAILLNQTAISITSPSVEMSDISNVVIRGDDGYNVTDYWQTGIESFGVSGYSFVDDTIYGATFSAGQGIYLHGTSALPPVVFNIIGGAINYVSNGVNYGNYVQGLSLTAVNMGPVANAIFSASGLSNTQSQLSITNSQFWCKTACINLGSPIAPMNISNNLFEIDTTATGIFLNPGALLTISGNSFIGLNSNASNTGVDIVNMTTFNNENAGVITGNQFFGLNHPIYLDTSSSGINVQSNSYQHSGGTNVTNLGTGNTVGGGSQ